MIQLCFVIDAKGWILTDDDLFLFLVIGGEDGFIEEVHVLSVGVLVVFELDGVRGEH
jgi:hypothetical protein